MAPVKRRRWFQTKGEALRTVGALLAAAGTLYLVGNRVGIFP